MHEPYDSMFSCDTDGHFVGYVVGRYHMLQMRTGGEAQLSDEDFDAADETIRGVDGLLLLREDLRQGWGESRDGTKELDTDILEFAGSLPHRIKPRIVHALTAIRRRSVKEELPQATDFIQKAIQRLGARNRLSADGDTLAGYRRQAEEHGEPKELKVKALISHPEIALELASNGIGPNDDKIRRFEVIEEKLERVGLRTYPPLVDADENAVKPTARRLNSTVKLLSLDMAGPDYDDDVFTVPIAIKEIAWSTLEWSVDETLRRIYEGTLDLQPSYQRGFVWPQKKVSALIESLLINVPIPPIYLSETAHQRFEVVDGQQRLTALRDFVREAIPHSRARPIIRDARYRRDLNGRVYSQLPAADQAKLMGRMLSFITICPSGEEAASKQFDPTIEVFTRLNQASTPLRPMELRNALYHGPYLRLLKSIAHDFAESLGHVVPRNALRMEREEAALRLFALWRNGTTSFAATTPFLDVEIKDHWNMSDDKCAELRANLEKGLRIAENAFVYDRQFARTFVPGESDQAPSGAWEKTARDGLFYVVLASLMRIDESAAMERLSSIREAFLSLVAHDPEFVAATDRFSNQKNLRILWSRWSAALDQTLAAPASTKWSDRRDDLLRRARCESCKRPIENVLDAVPADLEPGVESPSGPIAPYWTLDLGFHRALQHRGCWNRSHGVRLA